MKISIWKYGDVGEEITEWIQKIYPTHIQSILTPSCFNLYKRSENIPHLISSLKSKNLDYIILAWWPYIINKDIINIPKRGVINLHPSYLPWCRGKNYWFWNLVEDVPFGVTIHLVDESVDGGDILFQKKIEKTWEDTGETLFNKAQTEIVTLFKENYPKLISGNFTKTSQRSIIEQPVHYAKDLDEASKIYLDKYYLARDLLNLLRARSSDSFPSCYFYSNGNKYEVRTSIKKVS